jgi:hypothetical protein
MQYKEGYQVRITAASDSFIFALPSPSSASSIAINKHDKTQHLVVK